MPKLLEEIHPGEILLDDFMKPLGISERSGQADRGDLGLNAGRRALHSTS